MERPQYSQYSLEICHECVGKDRQKIDQMDRKGVQPVFENFVFNATFFIDAARTLPQSNPAWQNAGEGFSSNADGTNIQDVGWGTPYISTVYSIKYLWHKSVCHENPE